MTVRLGIWVGRSEARAIALRAGRVVWSSKATYDEGTKLDAAIRQLLADAPIGRLARPRVGVAIGIAHSDVREIDGLPPIKEAATINHIIRGSAESFFLRPNGRLDVSNAERFTNGTVWAAAFDGSVVDAVMSSLRCRGFRRISVIPSVIARSSLFTAGVHTVSEDGDTIEAVIADNGNVARLRRTLQSAPVETPPAPLSILGDAASEYVAPFAAAMAQSNGPFGWQSPATAAREQTASRLRLIVATTATVVGVLTALFAPSVREMTIARAGLRELATLHAREIEAEQTAAELRRLSGQLERLERFRSIRGQTTMLLGALSQALPESTALVSLRVDSLDASLVALTPRAAEIVPLLAAADGIVGPQIVGSVTRESIANARLERVTIRFRRHVAGAPMSAPNAARQ